MKIEYIVVPPQSEYAEAFAKAYSDYYRAGEKKYTDSYELGIKDFTAYLKWLSDLEKGLNLPEDWVPETTRWLINKQQEIVGFVRVRSGLTPTLEKEIGHIGYDVPPSQRRKGYGHYCLQVAVDIAKDLGLQRALVTCDSDNVASKRIIERAGAKLENEVIAAEKRYSVCRYWLEI